MGASPTIAEIADRVGIWAGDASGRFTLAYNKPPATSAMDLFNRVCITEEAKLLTERFAGIKGIAELQSFTGKVDYRGLDDWTVTAISDEYAGGLKMTYKQMKADEKNLKKLMALPELLALKAQRKRFELLASAIEDNGTWGVDSKALFADDHEFGDNNLAVTVSSTTLPTEADVGLILNAARNAFGSFTDDHGNKLNEITETQDLVIMHPAAWNDAMRRVRRQSLLPRSSSAIDNIDSGTFLPWNFPRLTSSTVLYAFTVDAQDSEGNPLGDSAPFVRTEFEPYGIEVGGGPDDSVYRNNREVEVNTYGIEGVTGLDCTRMCKITVS